jgi:hypothetical protein
MCWPSVEDTTDDDVKLMLATIPEISRHFVVCGKRGNLLEGLQSQTSAQFEQRICSQIHYPNHQAVEDCFGTAISSRFGRQ